MPTSADIYNYSARVQRARQMPALDLIGGPHMPTYTTTRPNRFPKIRDLGIISHGTAVHARPWFADQNMGDRGEVSRYNQVEVSNL